MSVSVRVERAARAYAFGEPVRNPPPSLSVWSMLKRQPNALGATSLLDQPGALWAEFEEYAAQEAAAEHATAERVAAERKRAMRGGGRR